MNNDPSPTPPDTRKWWRILIVTILLGPFVPLLLDHLSPQPLFQGLMRGLLLWLLALLIVSAITGWHLNARRDTAARLGLTVLFILAACAIGLCMGYAECSIYM